MRTLVAAGILAAALAGSLAFAQDPEEPKPEKPPVPEMMKEEPGLHLRVELRKLWADHLVYTRHSIISSIAGLPDTDPISKRLRRNQEEIGNAIKPYYGDEAGRKFTELLQSHQRLAGDYLRAARHGSRSEAHDQRKKWAGNARQIAAFLNSINPQWKRETAEELLAKQIDLTHEAVSARLKKDWEADIKATDAVHDQWMAFSDFLTHGIVRQFADRLRN